MLPWMHVVVGFDEHDVVSRDCLIAVITSRTRTLGDVGDNEQKRNENLDNPISLELIEEGEKEGPDLDSRSPGLARAPCRQEVVSIKHAGC